MTEPHTCCHHVLAELERVTNQLTELMQRPVIVDGVALDRAVTGHIVKVIAKSKQHGRRT